MMRLLLIVWLMPLVVDASISTNVASGSWTNPTTWVGGIVPTGTTAEACITGYAVNVHANITVSNVTLTGGTWTLGPGTVNNSTFRGVTTVSGGVWDIGQKTFYSTTKTIQDAYLIAGGVVSNGLLSSQISANSTHDYSALFNSRYLSNVTLRAGSPLGYHNHVLTNATSSQAIGFWPFGPSTPGGWLVMSNVNGFGAAVQWQGHFTNVTVAAVTWTNGLWNTAALYTAMVMTVRSSRFVSLGNVGWQFATIKGASVADSSFVCSNNTSYSFQLVTDSTVSNSTITVLGATGPGYKLGSGTWDALSVSNSATVTLGAAASVGRLNIGAGAQFWSLGFTTTETGGVANAGAISPSNSTFNVTSIVNSGTWSNMPGHTINFYGSGVLSNLPAGYNLYATPGVIVQFAGTNSTVLTGTLSFNGARLAGRTGGTSLVLSNPATVAFGGVYDIAATGKLLVVAHGTVTNATGILPRPFRGNQR